MDTQTIILLIAIVGCFVGLAGWLSTRECKISNDSEWKGAINAKLDAILGIDKRVDMLEKEVKKHGEKLAEINAKMEVKE